MPLAAADYVIVGAGSAGCVLAPRGRAALWGTVRDELRPGRRHEADAALEEQLRERVELIYHPVGTCRTGGAADLIRSGSAAPTSAAVA